MLLPACAWKARLSCKLNGASLLNKKSAKYSSELPAALLPCAAITGAWCCNMDADMGDPVDASPSGLLEGAAGTALLLQLALSMPTAIEIHADFQMALARLQALQNQAEVHSTSESVL